MPSIQHHGETSRQRLSMYNIYTTICQKTLDIGGQQYFSIYIDHLRCQSCSTYVCLLDVVNHITYYSQAQTIPTRKHFQSGSLQHIGSGRKLATLTTTGVVVNTGVVFRDEQGRLSGVKPSTKNGWPGRLTSRC